MHTVIRLSQNTLKAWQLGKDTPMEKKLIEGGRIVRLSADKYEVFSREAIGEHGELASAGDYFKLDVSGVPYPNSKEYFEANHKWIAGDEYLKISKQLQAWFIGDPENEIITFLRQNKGLQISPETPETCFSAPLWDTTLTAGHDAALVIFRIDREKSGRIIDVDFNFVARDEFENNYQML